MENTQNRVQWQPMVEMVIVLVTILGSTIPLYLHTDSKLQAAIESINKEMRDFHGRLCAIEEARK